jgi:lipoate-protein ligase A
MHLWRYIDDGPAPGARNMAVDEQLLEEAAKGGVLPVLRFYAWDPPAVSLGRFQDEATAVNRGACSARGIDIVRRATGGRAVLHHRELTYSIVSPVDDGLFPRDVIGTYKVIAQGLLAGLRRLGVPAELASRSPAPARDTGRTAACFAAPSLYELLVRGRKVAGSAQRRLPGAFLQHGSILIEYDAALEAAVIPGGGADHAATSLSRELGRTVTLDEVKRSFLAGFADALQLTFRS